MFVNPIGIKCRNLALESAIVAPTLLLWIARYRARFDQHNKKHSILSLTGLAPLYLAAIQIDRIFVQRIAEIQQHFQNLRTYSR